MVETYANNTLRIEGRQKIVVNGEEQEIVLTGLVRGEDIAPDNTVLSTFVADAEISFVGTGIVGEKNKPGLDVYKRQVRTVATQKVFSQGMYQQTDNPLDVVIEGDGFFQVLLPDGTICYTRDGAFKIDAYGRLTTSDGFPIEPEIQIPEEAVEVSISSDGTVAVMYPGVSDQMCIRDRRISP